VDALRPYVTVYPYAGGGGINPNTAPPYVLALLFFDDEVQLRLAGDHVQLSVLDDGPGFDPPVRPVTAPDGPGGWGLYLVDQCALRWGNEKGERHRVWLELERQDAA
jgi:hypothetical protein